MSTPLSPPSRASSPAPAYRRSPLRVGCVQFDVKLGRVEENAAKVETMTKRLRPGSLDLLVLPEMALSGYMFSNPTSILPYLENPKTGPTATLAKSLAKRIGCHVIAGYPEALEYAQSASTPTVEPTQASSASSSGAGPDLSPAYQVEGSGQSQPSGSGSGSGNGSGINQDSGPSSMKALEGEALGVGYNSAVVVNPEGEVVGNYRKTFRFETDKNWAREGDGFKYFDLGEPLGRTAVGICMDMNPKDFVAPWDAYELATFCRDNKVDTLVVPMNWLDPPEEPPNTAPPRDPEAPSEHNLNYWAARLQPLHDPSPGYSSAPTTSSTDLDPPPISGNGEVVFVSCNRVGTEEGSTFVGTSCVMTVSSDPSRIELVECCNITEERVMLATVT